MPVLRRGFTLEERRPRAGGRGRRHDGLSVREVMGVVRAQRCRVAAVGVDRQARRADFGVPTMALLELPIESFAPAECPQCAAGAPLTEPGSRFLAGRTAPGLTARARHRRLRHERSDSLAWCRPCAARIRTAPDDDREAKRRYGLARMIKLSSNENPHRALAARRWPRWPRSTRRAHLRRRRPCRAARRPRRAVRPRHRARRPRPRQQRDPADRSSTFVDRRRRGRDGRSDVLALPGGREACGADARRRAVARRRARPRRDGGRGDAATKAS